MLRRDQLDFKDEGAVRSNFGAGAALAVGQVRWDEQLPFGALFHQLQGFLPAGDDPVGPKGCRLIPAVEKNTNR